MTKRKDPAEFLKRGAPELPFNPDAAELLLQRMEDGEPITGKQGICGTSGIPSWPTICKWKRDNPSFATAYAQARESSAEACEHNAIDAGLSARGKETALAARVRAEVWWKAAAIRNPRIYGQKVDVNHSGTVTLEALITRSMETPAVQQHVAPTIEHEDD
jgi:hypothetical protein